MKTKFGKEFDQWLSNTPTIGVGYWGRSRGVNLKAMLHLWWQYRDEGWDFDLGFPYLNDELKIKIAEKEGGQLADEFFEYFESDFCPHFTVWIHGEAAYSQDDVEPDAGKWADTDDPGFDPVHFFSL